MKCYYQLLLIIHVTNKADVCCYASLANDKTLVFHVRNLCNNLLQFLRKQLRMEKPLYGLAIHEINKKHEVIPAIL